MIKKIITSIIGIILWLVVSCPALAQSGDFYTIWYEIEKRTNFKPISNQYFSFPSEEEAAKVFTEGKYLLNNIKTKESSTEIVPFDNTPASTQITSDSIQGQYYQNFKFYQGLLKSDLIEKQRYRDSKHYQDFYDQIVWKEDGKPDLTKAATAKAYLAFYNLIHNNGKPSWLKVGRIDEHFPLLGIYADDFDQLDKQFSNNDAYLWLTFELYYLSGLELMIPKEDKEEAENLAKQILYNNLQKYGITPYQADKWLEFATSWKSYISQGGIVAINHLGNWYCTIFIHNNKNLYLPLGLVALHEFQHTKDTFPGLKTSQQSLLRELTTTIEYIVEADNIYYQIHSTHNNYKHTHRHLGVKLEEIASFFRNLSKKYNTDNYAQLLLKPEATKYIEESYEKYMKASILEELKKQYGEDIPNISKQEMEKLKNINRPLVRKQIEEHIKKDNSKLE